MKNPSKAKGTGAKVTGNGEDANADDAVSLLKEDHRKVEQLFQQYEQTTDNARKMEIVKQAAAALIVHTILEEEIFYPSCGEKGVGHEALDEAQVEHDAVKMLIDDLLGGTPGSEFYDAKVKVLSEYVKHHVAEEEKDDDGIFAQAKDNDVDLKGVGQKIQERKQQLMGDPRVTAKPPRPRALHFQPQEQEYRTMPRYSNDHDRDEQGRFMRDDDERGYGRGYGRGERGSRGEEYGYDERAGRERDDRGRFMSEGGYERESGRNRYNYEEDEGYRGQGRGRGWYGDSEGHSRAAESRWEGRSGGEGRGRYEDDQERGRSGRGHGGWYGDPEGHSRAAESRWEGRSSSRYEDEDNGRQRSSGRGHGGWSGDPEGHAEASRRGWRNRDR